MLFELTEAGEPFVVAVVPVIALVARVLWRTLLEFVA